jgi:hypothetical protein
MAKELVKNRQSWRRALPAGARVAGLLRSQPDPSDEEDSLRYILVR